MPVVQSTSSLVRAISTFDDDVSLCRAVSVSTVLRGGAVIFKTSSGTATSYASSKKVDRIDVFVSHNWAVQRKFKFLVLAMYFNGPLAFVASLAVIALTAILIVVGWMPVFQFATVLSAPAFLLMLFFGHQVMNCAGRGQKVFLDKCCINQESEDLKGQGIAKLPAFMMKSSRVLVCYTDIYLKKLWTMFEVACFLMCHEVTDMNVMPTVFPLIIITSLLGSYMWLIGMVILEWLSFQSEADVRMVRMLDLVTVRLINSLLLRRWGRSLERMQTIARKFDVRDAVCFDPQDRGRVERNIIAFMKHYNFSDDHLGDDKTLNRFNELVRQKVPHAISLSLGRVGIPYWCVMLMQLTEVATEADIAAKALYNRDLNHEAVMYLLSSLSLHCSVWPLSCALLIALGRRCVNLPLCAEIGYIALMWSIYVVCFLRYHVHEWLVDLALNSNKYLTVLLILHLVLATITACVFRRPRSKLVADGVGKAPSSMAEPESGERIAQPCSRLTGDVIGREITDDSSDIILL